MRWFLALLTAISLLSGAAMAQEEVEVEVPIPDSVTVQGNLFAEVLILFGSFFILVSAIGILRYPDVYTRVHASTKLVALGGVGIFGGAALAFMQSAASERVLLVAAFFFLTAPLSGYMMARGSYLTGLPLYEEEGTVDEWGERGVMAEDADSQDAAADAARPARGAGSVS